MKRLGRIACLVMASVFLSSSIAAAVYAADPIKYSDFPGEGAGNQTTAIQKLYYQTLSGCVSRMGSYDVGTRWDWVDYHDIIYNGQVREEKHIFIADGWDNPWSSGTVSWGGGAYVEEKVTGTYSDGKIYCGENNNTMITQAAEVLGVDYWDIICDAYSGHANGGILYVDNTVTTCKDNSGNYFVNTGRDEYLSKLITDKTFKNSIPGGSLTSLTPIETYWANRLTFLSACATGSPQFGNANLAYQVVTLNNSSKAFEVAGYSQKNNSSHNAYTYGGAQVTCQDMVNTIGPDSQYTRAYILSVQKVNVDTCIADYQANLDVVAETINKYKEELNSEELAEEQKAGIQTEIIEPLQAFYDSKANPDTQNSGPVWKMDNLLDAVSCPGIDSFDDGMPDVPELSEVITNYDPTAPDEEGVITAETPPSCFDGGGALGWILCPVIEGLGNMTTFMYDTVLVDFLSVDAQLFKENPEEGTYRAWTVFQGFANIIFIILLIVVIFSQLTGVGIDNYGVKKILPKLIIAAILINLSYIICRLAVDVSNILGFGLRQIFVGIDIGASSTGAYSVPVGANLISTLVIALTLGVGLTFIIANGLAVLLPLGLAVLTAVIAIFFIFVLLGARQAGIVILTVIAPLAFVCYMLPNTKKLFDRWRKMFQGLLLLFPICGLLMGGSELASRILLSASSDNFWMGLIALLLGVVPFFFIPMLLKASFAAMGNIGAKISGIGAKVGGDLTKGIRNSEGYKDRYAKWAAGKDGGVRQRLANSRFGRIATGGAGRAGMARNRANLLKRERENQAVDNMMGTGFSAAMTRVQTDSEKQDLENEMALINKATNKGENAEALANEYSSAVASGNVMRARAIAEIAGRRKDTAAAFTKNMRSDIASGMYSGHEDVLKAVSKQIATGENSKQYRGSDALAFEYASQFNRGSAEGGTDLSYQDWVKDADNVNRAIENHITNGQELYGQKGRVLNELGSLTAGFAASTDTATANRGAADAAYLASLAGRAQEESAQTGVYDQTKENAMAKLQGFSDASAQQTSRIATQAAAQTASQAQQDAVFDIQRQTAQGIHEQNAASRGKENLVVRGGAPIRGFAPPAGFDLGTATHGSNGWVVERNGQRWNISKGRFES